MSRLPGECTPYPDNYASKDDVAAVASALAGHHIEAARALHEEIVGANEVVLRELAQVKNLCVTALGASLLLAFACLIAQIFRLMHRSAENFRP